MKEKVWIDDVGFLNSGLIKNFMCSRYKPGITTHNSTSRSALHMFIFLLKKIDALENVQKFISSQTIVYDEKYMPNFYIWSSNLNLLINQGH